MAANPQEILGRNLWGILRPLPSELEEHAARALESVDRLGEGGGLAAVVHSPIQKRVAWILLLHVYRALRQKHGQSAVFLFDAHEAGWADAKYCVFPDPGNLSFLLEQGTGGKVVIFACTHEEWEQLRPVVPYELYLFPPVPEELRQQAERDVAGEARRALGVAAEQVRRAFGYAVLLDALGLWLPYSLLARLMGEDEDRLEEEVVDPAGGLLYLGEHGEPPELLVTTAGEPLARLLFSDFWPGEEDVTRGCLEILYGIDPDARAERQVALGLLRELGRKGWRRCGLEVCRQAEARLAEVWRRGDALELLLWGRLFRGYRLFERSREVVQLGLGRNPEDPKLMHALLLLLAEWAEVETGKYEEAAVAFRKAWQRYPGNPYVLHSWANMERRLGNWRAAVRLLEGIREDDLPRASRLYFRVTRALALAVAGDGEGARHSLLSAAGEAATAGERAHAWHALGELERAEGRISEAEAYFQMVLRLPGEQRNTTALMSLAAMQGGRGQWRGAAQALEEVLAVDRDNVYALHYRGKMCREQGRLAQRQGRDAEPWWAPAAADLDAVRGLDPWNLQAVVELALLAADQGGRSVAADLLREGLKRQPGNAHLWAAAAQVELERGDLDTADRYLRSVQAPGPAVLNLLAKVHWQAGKEDEAYRYYLRALERARGIDRIVTLNGWAALVAKKSPDEAVRLLEQSLGIDPENAYTHLDLAAVLAALGRRERADAHTAEAKRLGLFLDAEEVGGGCR